MALHHRATGGPRTLLGPTCVAVSVGPAPPEGEVVPTVGPEGLTQAPPLGPGQPPGRGADHHKVFVVLEGNTLLRLESSNVGQTCPSKDNTVELPTTVWGIIKSEVVSYRLASISTVVFT